MLNSNNYTDYSWREVRYHSFYQVVDTVVKDIQNHIWVATGTAKKRLKGARLEIFITVSKFGHVCSIYDEFECDINKYELKNGNCKCLDQKFL